MNETDKFMRLFGGIFFVMGILLNAIEIIIYILFHELFSVCICLLIGIAFTAMGGGVLLTQLKVLFAHRKIQKQGKKYTGKIYGYVEDHSSTMNGACLVNTKVRYFDENGIEREAIIPTGFTKGSGAYPIGATIDITALNTSYSWDKNSVRYESIAGEEELMDNKPLDPAKLNMVAVTCPHCGASFSAAKGYVSTCAYCGGVLNV